MIRNSHSSPSGSATGKNVPGVQHATGYLPIQHGRLVAPFRLAEEIDYRRD